jgi:hypothetical protein
MKHEEIIAKIIRDYGIESHQIYKIIDGWDFKVILRKQAVDRIESILMLKGWRFDISCVQAPPYSDKAYPIVQAIAINEEGTNWMKISTLAGANPDNCMFPNYVEVAEKRARHRVILRAARLSELNVYSEEESHDFIPKNKGEEIAGKVVEKSYNYTDKIAAFDKNKLDRELKKLDIKLTKLVKANGKKKKKDKQ